MNVELLYFRETRAEALPARSTLLSLIDERFLKHDLCIAYCCR